MKYTRRPPDAAESLKAVPRTGRALHLNEFFTVASSYRKGPGVQRYCSTWQPAVPDSPEANINAAAVASPKAKTAKARRYLKDSPPCPWHTTTWAYSRLQEGNRDKAEV